MQYFFYRYCTCDVCQSPFKIFVWFILIYFNELLHFFSVLLWFSLFLLPEDNRRPSTDSRTRRSRSWASAPPRCRELALCGGCSVSWCAWEWRDLRSVRAVPQTARHSKPARMHPSCWRDAEPFAPSRCTRSPPIRKRISGLSFAGSAINTARNYGNWKIRRDRFALGAIFSFNVLIKNIFKQIIKYIPKRKKKINKIYKKN